MPFDIPYFPTQFDIGTPGAGHIHFASDGSMTLFGPDGVTALTTLDPVNGLTVTQGSIRGSSADFGDVAAGHIHFGTDGTMTLFASDGVTTFATLNTVGLKFFGSANTALTVAPGIAEAPALLFYSGNANENFPGRIISLLTAGVVQAEIDISTAQLGVGLQQGLISLLSESHDLAAPAAIILQAGHAGAANSGSVIWDGTTLTIGTLYAVTVTSPGDLRFSRNDGASPGIVTSSGFGGLRIIGIPGSAEVSFNMTPAGVINLGNGATSVGGSVNIRNPSAAALTQHTLTLQPVGSQTGDLLRAINSANSATWLAIDSNGHLCGRGTSPAVAAGAAMGTAPPAPVLNRGNDQAGRVTFGTGTATSAGVLCTITYNRAYANSNMVIVQQDAGPNALDLFCSNAAAGSIQVSCRVAPTASQVANTYGLTYQVIGN